MSVPSVYPGGFFWYAGGVKKVIRCCWRIHPRLRYKPEKRSQLNPGYAGISQFERSSEFANNIDVADPLVTVDCGRGNSLAAYPTYEQTPTWPFAV